MHAATVFKMKCFAGLLERLEAIPEGDANHLLHHSCIIGTTDTADGQQHEASQNNYPLIIAGRAGGALKGDVHYRSPNTEIIYKPMLPVIKALGLPINEYGGNTETIGALLA